MMVHQGAAAGQSGQSPATTAAWSPAAWSPLQGLDAAPTPTPTAGRKRRAETQDNNERLSKRLSLLNLEQSGSKLYVPVESPSLGLDTSTVTRHQQLPSPSYGDDLDDAMHLDDSKHKVYIYNIDDELASSSSSSDGDGDDGRLVFLPDIEQHLRDNRIPLRVLANPDGELAGMQVVLYSDPCSLTVPEERDGVRWAILDARRRIREKQSQERQGIALPETHTLHQSPGTQAMYDDGDAMDMD
ncbi:hypothetical protein G6O67_002146 [Ophiocordyceps sinensis]|uniref:Uncharacterized protein n=1 Tax=Ophiocordyceps sinensis TaxID=72228 RepID=A0A8H4V6X5_9HYPO|nr:hypothetical protein G6O67_002146 [Ophiocordyceps sinensis]